MAQHLRAWVAYSESDARLHYWRTRGGAEVDFVLYGTPGLWAFDVMNADRVRPADLRGLASFGDEYPEARRVLLYRGEHRLLRRGCGFRSIPITHSIPFRSLIPRDFDHSFQGISISDSG